MDQSKQCEWKEFYDDVAEMFPPSTPKYFFKKLSTIETTVIGAEFGDTKNRMEALCGLGYKLR
eukprot:15365068-Ditylum_brightwellii.AAC.2